MQMSLLGSLAAHIQHRDEFQEAAANQLPLVGPSMCPSLALSSPEGFLSSAAYKYRRTLAAMAALLCAVVCPRPQGKL